MNLKPIVGICTIISALSLCKASAQTLVLTGTNYYENFDNLSSGLPDGWSVRTNATSSNLGSLVAFSSSAKDWANTAGSFANYASTTNNSGAAFVGNESIAIQAAASNRAAGVRQTGALGDPGAAFVLRIDNTLGVGGFQASFDFENLSPQGRTTVWTIDYAIGNSPSSFTPVGTYTNSAAPAGVFGLTHQNFSFGSVLDNQVENVWIRVAALSGSTGSGSRSTFAIDNFNLSWKPVSTEAQPPKIETQPQSHTNFAGTSTTFTVSVSGTAPFTYQWSKDGQPLYDGANGYGSIISGANTATLNISSLRQEDAGSYAVSIANSVKSTNSQPAVLTVVNPTPISTNIAYLRTKMDSTDYLPTDTTNLYQVQGIVTTPVNLTTPDNAQFYIEDASGVGIAVFVGGGTSIRPDKGDLVKITGPLGHFNGLFELNLSAANFTHSVEIVSSGNPIPAPKPFNFTTASDFPTMESSVEGSLVVISNVFLQGAGSNFVSGANYNLTNMNGQVFPLRIDTRAVDVIGKPIPEFATSITGVMGQFVSTAPYTGGYQFFLTTYTDLVAGTPPPPSVSLSVRQVGNSIEISWPASASGFTLEKTTTLTSPSWQSAGAPTQVDGNNVVTISNPTGNTFFRLRQ